MVRIILAILLLLVSSVAHADQIKCLDTLAGAQYGDQLKAIPVEFGIRGFARKEFGDFFPVAKKELARGRPWVGVNLLWSDTHQYGEKDMPFILSEAKRYSPLCTAFPGTIELTPFTEHNLSNPDPFLERVQKAAPDCGIVNSVWNGKLSKRFKNEIHGPSHPKPNFGRYNYSYDGTNSVDSNVTAVLQKYSDAEVFCMWHPRLNLRWRDQDSASRAQRIKEAKERSPTPDMLRSLVYLFSKIGPISIPKNWLIKSHSEKHNAQDQKGDKLLIISPVKASAVELFRNGSPVARLKYYGVFDGGGFRYYWDQFGYKAGDTLDMMIGRKKYGVINGGFRAGNFR